MGLWNWKSDAPAVTGSWGEGLYLRTVVASSSSGLPSNTDPFFVNQCVEIHNQCRGKVNPPAANMKHMSWDATLAKAAKAWANKCKFHHSICSRRPEVCHQGFSSIGENIWLGSLSAFSPKAAITSWYNETAFYNFDTKSCSKICGHYTQVVWATSYKVGCGNALCPNLGGHGDVLFVCNYGPA
ncbi:GLIPR1-like protein 1 [Ctenodactylus gundi]